MSAQVEFFCSAVEERDVLRNLMKQADCAVFDVRNGKMTPWNPFIVDDVPAWPEPLDIYLWNPRHGSLTWHTTSPEAIGPTHKSLVINLFAREEWNAQGLEDGDKMLDTDLSPIMHYHRGSTRDGRMGPCRIVAPPSNLQRVGPEYERYVKRSLAWVRRRGKIVHDWRKQSACIPNFDHIVNTIYALPDAQKALESEHHKFAIIC